MTFGTLLYDAQVRFLYDGIAHERYSIAANDDSSLFQDIASIAELQSLYGSLLHQKNSDLQLRLDFPNRIKDHVSELR